LSGLGVRLQRSDLSDDRHAVLGAGAMQAMKMQDIAMVQPAGSALVLGIFPVKSRMEGFLSLSLYKVNVLVDIM